MSAPASHEEIRDVNTRYHDVAAEHYDAKWGIDFGEIGSRQVTAKVRKALGADQMPAHPRGLPIYARALEVGAGTGYFTLNLMRAGVIEHATCTDISPGMLATLSANAERLGLAVETVSADAERLPFPDGSFDLVFGHAVLHHIPDLAAAFGEFARVLAPGGTVLFAGEPSHTGDRLARVPKRAAGALAPLWRAALRARPAGWAGTGSEGAPDAALESVVDVTRLHPRRAARARRAAPPSNGCASAARSWWPTGSGGPTAPWRPPRSPPTYRGRGASTPTAATWRCRRSTAACWSRGCQPALFYNLLLSARRG